MQVIIISVIAFIVGFVAAWLIRNQALNTIKKEQHDMTGFLEREKLGKERLQREVELFLQRENELSRKLESAEKLIRQMDADILLLQKHNEETEDMLKAQSPEIYALKIKLIEAGNTIARLKSKESPAYAK